MAQSQSCIFCRIGRGEVPSTMVHSDEWCFVIKDIHPRAPIHLLVIPREHVLALTGVGPKDKALLGHLLTVAAKVAKESGLAEHGYRLVVNQGADSGQEVPHLHMHVLGGRGLGGMVSSRETRGH
jgi:histidine triad (HIT) family protein